jgi:hypothetical protein
MMAMFTRGWMATDANQSPSRHMPCSMSASHCMGAFAAATGALALMIKTDVITSVSLFVLVHLLVPVSLLIGLVVLISILLTCLTRLMRLESLVGLNSEIATRCVQGD